MILWFTYVKGAWRALTGKFGAGITFKTTLKGAGRLLDSVLTDLWMPTLCFIASAVSLGVGIHKLVRPLSCIALCVEIVRDVCAWQGCAPLRLPPLLALACTSW